MARDRSGHRRAGTGPKAPLADSAVPGDAPSCSRPRSRRAGARQNFISLRTGSRASRNAGYRNIINMADSGIGSHDTSRSGGSRAGTLARPIACDKQFSRASGRAMVDARAARSICTGTAHRSEPPPPRCGRADSRIRLMRFRVAPVEPGLSWRTGGLFALSPQAALPRTIRAGPGPRASLLFPPDAARQVRAPRDPGRRLAR
jgi:hypothetical protein